MFPYTAIIIIMIIILILINSLIYAFLYIKISFWHKTTMIDEYLNMVNDVCTSHNVTYINIRQPYLQNVPVFKGSLPGFSYSRLFIKSHYFVSEDGEHPNFRGMFMCISDDMMMNLFLITITTCNNFLYHIVISMLLSIYLLSLQLVLLSRHSLLRFCTNGFTLVASDWI